jgi:uncharacterized protein
VQRITALHLTGKFPVVVSGTKDAGMLSAELERLQQLRQSGALTEEEFQAAKRQVLNAAGVTPGGPEPPQGFVTTNSQDNPFAYGSPGPVPGNSDLICGMQSKLWITLMHLSQLLTWTLLGIAAPIIMWIVSKDESKEANRHGLIILNWLLSTLVYGIISFLLMFVVIGVPMLIVLGALNVIFPILGAIHANNGKAWKYPLSINFFNPDSV